MNEDVGDSVFVALIGDIRGSRELEERQEAQHEFKRVVNAPTEASSGQLDRDTAHRGDW